MKKYFLLLSIVAVLLLTAIFYSSCSLDSKVQPPTYTAYVTVRSVWSECHGYECRTVVSFAPDSDTKKLMTLEFNAIEPSLWQGLHAVVVYQRAETWDEKEETCVYDSRPVFHLISMEQLE